MGKENVIYVCSECGYQSIRWLGKCPECGKWNTFVEEVNLKTPDCRTPWSW